ncbi:MAG: hypothetical protein WBZ29_10125 [Methanocella sp.]
MVSPVPAAQKVIVTLFLIPLAIVLIASLLAYTYFYFTTGGFAPSLTDRLLGLNPANTYLILSLAFGFAVLVAVMCGSVIRIAIEVYRIRKLMEGADTIIEQDRQ